MSLVFSTEHFADVRDELRPLWEKNWEESEIDKSEIPFDPDCDGYERLDRYGVLCTAIIRNDDKIVGYAILFMNKHMHHRSTMFATYDAYWISPTYRAPRVAIRFFKYIEATMAEKGIEKIISHSRGPHHSERLWILLGYSMNEVNYTKVLKKGAK